MSSLFGARRVDGVFARRVLVHLLVLAGCKTLASGLRRCSVHASNATPVQCYGAALGTAAERSVSKRNTSGEELSTTQRCGSTPHNAELQDSKLAYTIVAVA